MTETDFDRTPPHDDVAELAVLACLLTEPHIRLDVWKLISPQDFYRPRHQQIAEIIADVPNADPTIVLAEIRRRPFTDAERTTLLQLLPSLVTRDHVAEHAAVYAQEVLATSRRRQLIALVTRGLQQAYNPTADVDELAVGLLMESEALVEARPRETNPPPSVEDFLAGEDRFDWVIPNFLERGDRVILTGGEGGGKSTWERQIAVCAAAGLHPVSFAPIDPQRVLLIDLENGRMHLRRQFRPLVELAKREGQWDPDRLRIVHRPEGIDLASLADVAWLTDVVLAARPDLLIVAPLYKLHTQAMDKEEAARGITQVLDSLRARARCAVIIEAHAGHGVGGSMRSWRPAGSSLFMRWPEFGFGLKPNQRDGSVTVKHWRGPRDERTWPLKMRRGGPNGWPWMEDVPDAGEEMWSA